MSNLIPTPIVDKNGVPSIRHKKPASAQSQSNLPAPALVSARNPRHLVIDSIMEAIRDKFTPDDNKRYRDKMIDISRNLSGAEDDEYPQQVLEMVSKVVPAMNKRVVDMQRFINILANSDASEVKSLCAHADYLASTPHSISNFSSLRTLLMETLRVMPDDRGYFPTIEAHIDAKTAYSIMAGELGWTDNFFYPKNLPAVRMVERYPNRVKELMEFIARGNTLDEKDFEAYVALGAVREGML